MTKGILVALLLSLWAPLCASGQDAAPGADRPVTEEWGQVLRFGIDSEVLKVIQQLKATGETALDRELVEAFGGSLNQEVREAVLDLFGSRKSPDLEGPALAVVRSAEESEPELVRACVDYLRRIRSSGVAAAAAGLLDSASVAVAEAAIKALGELGDQASGQALLASLEDPRYPEERKAPIILALGELRFEPAVPVLIDLVSSRDTERMWRLYAADSLGKIGDPRAVPVLKGLFEEQDSLVKAYAASALAGFGMEEVEPVLQQALRDSNVRVRLAAAKALARPEARGSVEMLIYKARRDPEKAVRLQAIESLGAVGGAAAMEFLRELYADRLAGAGYREAALQQLVAGDISGATLQVVRRVVAAEEAVKDSPILLMTARLLSTAEGSGLEPLYRGFLRHRNAAIRLYGIRGAERNRLGGLKEAIRALSEEDPYPVVRRAALAALEKL